MSNTGPDEAKRPEVAPTETPTEVVDAELMPQNPTTPTETPTEVVDAELMPQNPTTPIATGAVAVEQTGYTSSGVPTFDYAREKIETRYGTAIGAAELAAETPEGRTVEQQYEARQRAAAERLAAIRASMRDDGADDV